MSTLFEISEEMIALDELLTNLDGEIPNEEIEAQLDAYFKDLGDRRDEKLDSYAALIKTMEARAKVRKEEAARMTALATTDENAAKRLKSRLQDFYTLHGYTKPIETRRYKIALQNNGGVVPVILNADIADKPEELPERFRKVEFSAKIDAIREALTGPDCEEKEEAVKIAKLGDRGQHVRIR